MIPGGYGFEVLRFEDDNIRDIQRLPKDVRVVCALPGADTVLLPPNWYAPGPCLRPIFLLICHRYCVRVPAGCQYSFTSLDDFLSRYYELQIAEKKPLEPCDEDYQRPREAWHVGDDGVPHEYIWHPTGGWVRR